VAAADFLDIDLFPKPTGYADYDIKFAATKMVLRYLQTELTAKATQLVMALPSTPPISIPRVVQAGTTLCASSM
jgi:hypothetical protein